MSTEEIIIFAALVAFSVLCVLAFFTWVISLVCICTQKNVNNPKVTERNIEVPASPALMGGDKNCIDIDIDDRPSLFTPSTNYEGYLSIHTAWAQGQSSID